MDRVAVFVDAGYLFASAGHLLADRRTTRGELSIDVDAAEACIRVFAEKVTGLPLLRIYWYDGTSGGPTPDHVRLMQTQNVKVRLGTVNTVGEQKGVDSLIMSDMIKLSRIPHIASAVLMTGDEDLRLGVQHFQEAGQRVYLIGITPTHDNQSKLLQQEADQVHAWGLDEITRFLALRQPFVLGELGSLEDASRVQVIDTVVAHVAQALDDDARARLKADFDAGVPQIPRDVDARLVKTLNEHLGPLDDHDKYEMRRRFKDLVRGS